MYSNNFLRFNRISTKPPNKEESKSSEQKQCLSLEVTPFGHRCPTKYVDNPFCCKYVDCKPSLQNYEFEAKLRIRWPSINRITQLWFHLECFSKCNKLQQDMHGLNSYVVGKDMIGHQLLTVQQQQKIEQTLSTFYSQFTRLPKQLLMKKLLSVSEIKEQLNQRLLNTKGDETELRQRLKQFLNHDIFNNHEKEQIDLLINGFIHQNEKTYNNMYMPIYLRQIVIKYYPPLIQLV